MESITQKFFAEEEYILEADQLKQQGKLIQAIDLYSKALQVQPNSVQAHYQLAEAYENLKEYEQAITHLS